MGLIERADTFLYGRTVYQPTDRRTLKLVETRSFDARTVLLRHDLV